jgi:hypothetical protein
VEILINEITTLKLCMATVNFKRRREKTRGKESIVNDK